MIIYASPQPSVFTTNVLYPSLVAGFIAIMAVLGWGFRAMLRNLSEISKQLQRHEQDIALIQARYPINIRRLDDAEDVIEEIRTKQAVEHATLHDHLRWHERQRAT